MEKKNVFLLLIMIFLTLSFMVFTGCYTIKTETATDQETIASGNYCMLFIGVKDNNQIIGFDNQPVRWNSNTSNYDNPFDLVDYDKVVVISADRHTLEARFFILLIPKTAAIEYDFLPGRYYVISKNMSMDLTVTDVTEDVQKGRGKYSSAFKSAKKKLKL